MFDLMNSMQKLCIVFRAMGLGFVATTQEGSTTSAIAKNRATILFLLHLIVVAINVALMWRFHRFVYYYHDTMGAVNDLIKYFATVSATISIIVESYLKREKLAQIKELAATFQQEMVLFLRRKELLRSNRNFWLKYKIKFFAFTVLYVLSEAVLIPVYLLNLDYRNSIAYFMSTNVMICICRYRHLQHVLYMDVVDHELELMVHVLRDGKVSAVKLRRLQELYGMAVEMVKLQNDFFGLSQSMNIVFNHLQLLGDGYWVYWRHLNGCCSIGFFRILITMGHTSWLLYIVFASSVSCLNRVAHLSYWLHKLPRNGIPSSMINNFSLEMMYNGIQFWAFSLFPIDFSALIQIAMSIMKFVIMFTQFASTNNQGKYLNQN